MYMTSDNHFLKIMDEPQGFTLIELCVFMTIISILATGVVYMYSNPTAKVKGVMFNVLSDLNFARSESVNRNKDVLVDFVLGDKDGYLICIDTDTDKDCDDDDEGEEEDEGVGEDDGAVEVVRLVIERVDSRARQEAIMRQHEVVRLVIERVDSRARQEACIGAHV